MHPKGIKAGEVPDRIGRTAKPHAATDVWVAVLKYRFPLNESRVP